uniref:CSON003885 protein n=1 Tax=Culicoides sonorensis TaxID=179676 RepID=A0A336MQ55_CULSO
MDTSEDIQNKDEIKSDKTQESEKKCTKTTSGVLVRVLKDLLYIAFLGSPMIVYKLLQLVINKTHHGGFFCEDKSLQFPYKESTISETAVVYQTLCVPIFTILVLEYFYPKYKRNTTKNLDTELNTDNNDDNDNTNSSKVNVTQILYNRIVNYIFGYNACCSFMWMPKFFDGNLRPHFMDVCRPVMWDGSDCSDIKNHGRFILDYECSNENYFTSIYRSFPSGHSSQSFFAATYLVLYLQRKLLNEKLRIGLQFLLLLYAYAVSISRIYDFHHHTQDVVVGCSLGVFCAMVLALVVERNFKEKEQIRKSSVKLT